MIHHYLPTCFLRWWWLLFLFSDSKFHGFPRILRSQMFMELPRLCPVKPHHHQPHKKKGETEAPTSPNFREHCESYKSLLLKWTYRSITLESFQPIFDFLGLLANPPSCCWWSFSTLLWTHISHPKATFENSFPLPVVGYVRNSALSPVRPRALGKELCALPHLRMNRASF